MHTLTSVHPVHTLPLVLHIVYTHSPCTPCVHAHSPHTVCTHSSHRLSCRDRPDGALSGLCKQLSLGSTVHFCLLCARARVDTQQCLSTTSPSCREAGGSRVPSQVGLTACSQLCSSLPQQHPRGSSLPFDGGSRLTGPRSHSLGRATTGFAHAPAHVRVHTVAPESSAGRMGASPRAPRPASAGPGVPASSEDAGLGAQTCSLGAGTQREARG